jgi:transposase
MSKFVDCARDQAFLLPPDLRDWIPEDDLAHFVIEAVERVAMGAFKVNQRGTGSAQYHPRMMLALLIYCYANGIFSSRRIERATHRDIGVRFVTANRHPDHDTIATFRRDNVAAVAESFLQVLLLAKELRLLKLGVVSVDGSKFDASASKHRSVTYARAGALVDQLRLEIAELLARAEAAWRGGSPGLAEGDRPPGGSARSAGRGQASSGGPGQGARRDGADGLPSQGGGAREAQGPGQGQAPEAAQRHAAAG